MCVTDTVGKPRDGGQCRARLVNPSRMVTPLGRIDASGVEGSLDGSSMQAIEAMQAMPRSTLGGDVEKG